MYFLSRDETSAPHNVYNYLFYSDKPRIKSQYVLQVCTLPPSSESEVVIGMENGGHGGIMWSLNNSLLKKRFSSQLRGLLKRVSVEGGITSAFFTPRSPISIQYKSLMNGVMSKLPNCVGFAPWIYHCEKQFWSLKPWVILLFHPKPLDLSESVFSEAILCVGTT